MRWLLTALFLLLAAPVSLGQSFSVERYPAAPAGSWHRHQCPAGHVYAHAGGPHVCPICGLPTDDVIYEGNQPIMAYAGAQPRAPQYASVGQQQYARPYPAPPSVPRPAPSGLTLVVCSYDQDRAGNPATCQYCTEQLQVPMAAAAPAEVRLVKNDWARFADPKWQVTRFPTLILFRNGQEVRRHVGLMTEQPLRRWLDETIAAPMVAQAQPYVIQGGSQPLPAAPPAVQLPTPQPYGLSYRAADGSIVIPVPFNIQLPPPMTVRPNPVINVVPHGAPVMTPQAIPQSYPRSAGGFPFATANGCPPGASYCPIPR